MTVGFLHLPGELRKYVYDYYFLPADILNLAPVCNKKYIPESAPIFSSDRIAFTLTCRTVRQECLDLAFATTAFHLYKCRKPPSATDISALRAINADLCLRIGDLGPVLSSYVQHLALFAFHVDFFSPYVHCNSIPSPHRALSPDSRFSLPNLTTVSLQPAGGLNPTNAVGTCVTLAALHPHLQKVAILATWDPVERLERLESEWGDPYHQDRLSDVLPPSRVEGELSTVRGYFRDFLRSSFLKAQNGALGYVEGLEYVHLRDQGEDLHPACIAVRRATGGVKSGMQESRDYWREIESDVEEEFGPVHHVYVFWGPTEHVRLFLARVWINVCPKDDLW